MRQYCAITYIGAILSQQCDGSALGWRFYSNWKYAAVVSWRVDTDCLRARVIHLEVIAQDNAGQRNRLLWAFYLLFRTVRTQGDIETLGVTAAVTFVDALYGLD